MLKIPDDFIKEAHDNLYDGIKHTKFPYSYDKIFNVTSNLFPPVVDYTDAFEFTSEGKEIIYAKVEYSDTDSLYKAGIVKNSTIVPFKKEVIESKHHREMFMDTIRMIGYHIPLMHDKNAFKVLEDQSFTNNSTAWNSGILTTMSDGWRAVVDRGYIPKVWLFPLRFMYDILDALDTVKWHDHAEYYFSKYISTSYAYVFHPFDNLHFSFKRDMPLMEISYNFSADEINVKITIRDAIRVEDVNQVQRISLSIT